MHEREDMKRISVTVATIPSSAEHSNATSSLTEVGYWGAQPPEIHPPMKEIPRERKAFNFYTDFCRLSPPGVFSIVVAPGSEPTRTHSPHVECP